MVRGNKFKPSATSLGGPADQPAEPVDKEVQTQGLPHSSTADYSHTKQHLRKLRNVKQTELEQPFEPAAKQSPAAPTSKPPAPAASSQAATSQSRGQKRKLWNTGRTVPEQPPETATDSEQVASASKRSRTLVTGQRATLSTHSKHTKSSDLSLSPEAAAEPALSATASRQRSAPAVSQQAAAEPPTTGKSLTGKRSKKRKNNQLHDDSKHAGGNSSEAAPDRVFLPVSIAAPRKGESGSSNWLTLKAALQQHHQHQQQQQQHQQPKPPSSTPSHRKTARRPKPALSTPADGTAAKADNAELTDIVALDCEMVGVGSGGTRSALARVCIVNDHGHVLLDCWVQPGERVTDFRTHVSGVRPHHLQNATAFAVARAKVIELTHGRTIVGHALGNDLGVLELEHSQKRIRDTAHYPPLMWRLAESRAPRSRGLRPLALEHLGLVIQSGEHSPVDDARSALYLYHQHRKEWEYRLSRGTLNQLQAPIKPGREKLAMSKSAYSGKSFAQLAARDEMVDL